MTKRFLLTVVCLAAALGAASLWQLAEQDIYWQIRAGEELLRTGTVPWVDTWSYTAAGQPWLNIQWLATVIFYGVWHLGTALGGAGGGEAALVLLRGAMVGALMAAMAMAVAQTSKAWPQQLLTGLAVLPCAYIAMLPRLQVRSDTFVFIAAAMMLALWQHAHRWRREATVLLTALAANLHAGTAPLLVLLAIGLLAQDSEPVRRRVAWCLIVVLSYFATPYSYRPLQLVWSHALYAQNSTMHNPDQVPMQLADLWTASGLAWGVLTAAAVAAWLQQHRRPNVWLAVTVVLTALSCARTRIVPYQVLWLLPQLARARLPMPVQVATAGAALTAMLTVVTRTSPQWGLGVQPGMYPVGATQFIEAQHPRGNLFHSFADGAYLVWYARDYLDCADTRETMFWALQPQLRKAFASPAGMEELLHTYDVHTVLMPRPRRDALTAFFPPQRWALVYLDAQSAVLVDRQEAHAAMIAQFEIAAR